MSVQAGIYGIGIALPEHVRDNDWWPENIVQGWRDQRTQRTVVKAEADTQDSNSAEAVRTREAMKKIAPDPFQGARSRHVMSEQMLSSTLETQAARTALSKAGVDASEIDLVITQTTRPDFLHQSNSSVVHQSLGLSPKCFSFATEGMCNAFQIHLSLASQMIATGAARHALLIQTSDILRFMRPEDQFSTWFGDGAAATVIGPVASNRGVIAQNHRTDGNMSGSIVSGLPGRSWYEDGRIISYLESPRRARNMLLRCAEEGKIIMDELFAASGLSSADVDFYAAHQGTSWFREVTQDCFGFEKAAFLDTFATHGSLIGANIPLALCLAEEQSLLKSGDLVASFSGAAGMSCSGMLMRWGRS